MERGNRVVSPALYSRCAAGTGQQYIPIFGWGLLLFGALAAGAIVVLAEPEIGRALALKMPFVVAAIGSFAMFVYGLFWLKIDQNESVVAGAMLIAVDFYWLTSQ